MGIVTLKVFMAKNTFLYAIFVVTSAHSYVDKAFNQKPRTHSLAALI